MRKNLKNYTTSIAVEKTLAQIEELVVKHGATQFFKEYSNGVITQVIFIIPTLSGNLPVRMPARIEQATMKMYGRTNVTDSMSAQAKRTAWRNIFDWLDAQMALVETAQVTIEEIFLPYVMVNQNQTMFDVIKDAGFKLPERT